MTNMIDCPPGIERGDKDDRRIAGRQIGDRLCSTPDKGLPQHFDILDIGVAESDAGKIVKLRQARIQTHWIVERNTACRLKPGNQRLRAPGGHRVADRFIERVAALYVVKSLNGKRHQVRPRKCLNQAESLWRFSSRRTTASLATQLS